MLSEKVAPEPYDDLEQMSRWKPPLFSSILTQVDDQVSFSKGPHAEAAFSISLDEQGFQGGLSREMFGAVRKILDEDKPHAVLVDPLQELIFLPARKPQSVASCLVLGKPVTPHPFVEVVSADGTMHRASRRMWLFDEFVKVLDQQCVEVSRRLDVEHAQSRPHDEGGEFPSNSLTTRGCRRPYSEKHSGDPSRKIIGAVLLEVGRRPVTLR